jgi:nicotinamidase-related amidase
MEFGCLANENFRRALENSGRRQLLVCGMETHICVMQTVLAALEAGYEVFVVRDAVASMHETEHEAGLARMKQAGAVIVTTQMTLFELLRAAGTPAFRSMLPLLK